ncbi:hypothetical protein [Helicobacter sp. 13S00477-4]|uniref:hypothetical protein n=1 Tax=Helicobacter sp. 13S00477-4 TaxID=1905759 RepID=UPI000BA6BF2F|nr:hypothetical protein [Helicobacter sp. 13S00477-4]PAF52687.1 hypothetical protein BKH44_00445 [Helicobacter sp. 13S00477-4]
MQKLFLAIILVYCYFLYANPKNGLDYLKEQVPILKSYYNQVKSQSLDKNYPIFRNRKIIEHSVYLHLKNKDKQNFKGQIVLTHFFLKNFIKYSNFGGVGVGGILVSESDDKKAKLHYYKFDGRYLSDLELLGIGLDIYAYCILPDFNQCILLGIGEDWK